MPIPKTIALVPVVASALGTGGQRYLADGTLRAEALAKRARCRSGEDACPAGHMEPLGSGREPTAPLDVYTYPERPTAQEFWTKHVHFSGNGTPAVFRGWASHHHAALTWLDDAYLNSTYGNVRLKVEPAREERVSDHCARRNRQGRWVDSRGEPPIYTVPCPEDLDLWAANDEEISMSEFLSRYKTEDIYAITQMHTEMTREVLVPSFAQCGHRRREGFDTHAHSASRVPRSTRHQYFQICMIVSFQMFMSRNIVNVIAEVR
jgi:hypothetical protein